MFYRLSGTALALLCLVTPAYAHHPSAETKPAAALPQGKLSLAVTSSYVRFDRFSDDELITMAGEHIHAHSYDWLMTNTIGISYGLYDNISLTLTIPQTHRENLRAGHHSHGSGSGEAGDHGDVSGIGDMSLLAEYGFWQQEKMHAALLFGVKTPTGRTSARHGGERLETEHQPGSGSWDGMFGFAAGTAIGPVTLDASALYTAATEGAQDTGLGDRVQYDLGLAWRIMPEHGLDLTLTLNGEWNDHLKEAGETDEESGGDLIFLSPGIRYDSGRDWSAHFSVGMPIVDHHGLGHADTDYKVTVGIVKEF